jgi:hypothetical protein
MQLQPFIEKLVVCSSAIGQLQNSCASTQKQRLSYY